MNKPILLLSSSNLSEDLPNLYHLRGYASVLNLQDEGVTDDMIKQYNAKNIIICNMSDPKQVGKLRFIAHGSVHRVCVLRPTESSVAPWVVKSQADYCIKETGFMKDCASIVEFLTYVVHLNNFKKPDGTLMFYLRKLSFLFRCFN